MQCFQNELMRSWLFARASELDPSVQRDDLMLDEVLADAGIVGLDGLAALGHDHAVVEEVPLAA